ncbi:MAG: VOC family protein [Chloroflexota bacterium]
MKISAIEHIAINVSDIQKSIDFYGSILGFTRLQSVDRGDSIIHYYQLPNSARLELFEYKKPGVNQTREVSEVGLKHLAFQVEDVAAHEKELRAAGVEITLSTCELPDLGTRVLLFLDPNGVTLEFCEKL